MKIDDYTQRSWQAAFALIVVLVVVSFIPAQRIGGVQLRRANILSDVYQFRDHMVGKPSELPLDDEFDGDYHRYTTELKERAMDSTALLPPAIDTDTAVLPQTTFRWALPQERVVLRPLLTDSLSVEASLTRIENFDTLPDGAFVAFCQRLAQPHRDRPVRIAVLGDSFIEGDILTVDVREQLQQRYGGCGCGFTPIASPLTGYRRSVKTRWEGWTNYNIMQRRNTPESFRDDYFVSGWICKPASQATVRWEGTTFRRGVDSCEVARILFLAQQDCCVQLTANDTLKQTFFIPAARDWVRQIVVEMPLASLELTLLEGADGFIGYGAQFESLRGVTVDNYSIRSNNGQALFGTSTTINRQIAEMAPYDLVILQYGLNIMQENVTNYSGYASRVEKMISLVRECFPSAAVMVFSTSDRSVKSESGYASINSASAMIRWQRQAAKNMGATFWSVYDAMQRYGGMERFVANGWAGKDYTHINYAGGGKIADAFVKALNAYVQECVAEQLHAEEPIIDSVRVISLQNELAPILKFCQPDGTYPRDSE